MKKQYWISLLCIIFSFYSHGQDIHFTQYDLAPLYLNPGLTGAYLGTARIGGIYRDQDFAITTNRYKTPAVYIDAPIIRGFREQDWVGVGGVFISDNAGIAQFKYNYAFVGAAYHLGLGNSVLTLGAQYGSVTFSLEDEELLTFEDEISGNVPTGGSEDRDLVKGGGNSRTDLAFGLLLRSPLGETDKLEIGIKAEHFLKQDRSIGGKAVDPPVSFLGHIAYERTMENDIIFAPQVFVHNYDQYLEMSLQAKLKFPLNMNEKPFHLVGGLGYRYSDAIEVLVGAEWEQLRIGLAYDVNISKKVPASNTVGALEVGAAYILRIYPKPDDEPAIFCPRF